MNNIRPTRIFMSNVIRVTQMSTKSEPSNTSGSAGAIREAGGAFGKLGAAKEAEYFYKKQTEQLQNLIHKDNAPKESQKSE